VFAVIISSSLDVNRVVEIKAHDARQDRNCEVTNKKIGTLKLVECAG
jgi:hypothetical protein